MNTSRKVQVLQSKLSRAAKQSLDRRFGALYDKIYRRDVLKEAWKRVRANKGAPGVDEQDFEWIEQELGIRSFLEEIRRELKSQRYRPKPVKRCWIDKPGKPEKRPLGIPVIRDRVTQMACKLVIEPIFETNFLACSYGYRPKRSAKMAILTIQRAISHARQTVIVDCDIRGFFDNVDHRILLNLVRRRISDPRVLKLIGGWLKAGVMEDGTYTPPDVIGTPQGGVISPLLANVYLHSLDKMFKESDLSGTWVRYADDIVIAAWGGGQHILKRLRQMLGRLKLELSEEKTRVVKAEDGFDFLGVHFKLCPVTSPGKKLEQVCRVWPSDRSMKRIREKIRTKIGRRYSKSLEEMIEELNPVLRGWHNYHKAVDPYPRRILNLNRYVWDRLRIFLRRKHNDDTRGCRRLRGGLLTSLGLYQFA
jgi:group II intron reverse transcriptase/maturase